MKSEKHVTLAAQIVKTINPSVGVYEFNMDDLKEAIVSALSQVEREALASKVVFPDDEELLKRNEKYIKANKSSKNTFDDLDFAYYHGQLDLIDELKTAPNEPEVKAQEWAEKKASDIVNKFLHKPITDTYLCILKDEIIAVLLDAVDISKKYEKHDQSKTLNEKSDIPRSEVKAQGFEELFNLKIKPLLNSSEAFVTYAPYEWFLEFFKAGQKSQATTLKLPDKKCNRYDETDDLIGTIEVVTHNSLLDKIIRLNPEFKIQVVLDAVKSMNEGE